jgi:DNA repair ATPase RecN
MKLIKFETQNFKNITAAEVNLQGKSLVVTGGNAQGKTSLIDAIEFAIVGKKRGSDLPVKLGEKKAHTLLETDELIINRTITATGNHVLKVESKDGAEYKKPQAFLDQFYHTIGLTPAKFLELSSEERFEAIMQAIGKYEEYSKLRSEFDDLYKKRRDSKRARGAIDISDVVRVDEKKMKDLQSELNDIENYEKLRKSQEKYDKRIDERRQAIKKMQDEIKELERENEVDVNHATALDEQIHKLNVPMADEIEEHKEESKEHLKSLEIRKAVFEREQEKVIKAEKLDDLIAKYEKAIADNRERVAQICEEEVREQYPEIKGIKLEEGEIYLNGIPMSSMSTSESLKLAAIIMSKNTEKNDILIIKDGNDFDDEALKGLIEYAEENDKQIIIERITAPEEIGDLAIEIKEGKVKE